MNVDIEIWKDIEGCEGLYQVSNQGRIGSYKVRATTNTRDSIFILKPYIGNNGYSCQMLKHNRIQKNHSIHRLVAKAFIPNPENKPCVNHLDGNKLNNNDWNLAWVTYSENEIHSYRVLNKKPNTVSKGRFGSLHHRSKTVLQYSLKGDFISVYGSAFEAQRKNGFHRSGIAQCCRGILKTFRGYKWKYTESKPLI